jgi:hypothetical protein
VRLGTDPFRGAVTRDDVAAVLVAVLDEARSAGLVLYVANGDEPVDEAVSEALA